VRAQHGFRVAGGIGVHGSTSGSESVKTNGFAVSKWTKAPLGTPGGAFEVQSIDQLRAELPST
jgi:hypothetical protein